jgi:hypothetical protein
MAKHGVVDLGDASHSYKQKLKVELGGDRGIGQLLGSAGQTNFDFYVNKDGSVEISDNGQGGQGVDTGVNFFDLFPETKPDEPDVAPQERELGLPPDTDDEPQPGEMFEGDDGKRYYVADDGRHYEVLQDDHGNDYYEDDNGDSHDIG